MLYAWVLLTNFELQAYFSVWRVNGDDLRISKLRWVLSVVLAQ